MAVKKKSLFFVGRGNGRVTMAHWMTLNTRLWAALIGLSEMKMGNLPGSGSGRAQGREEETLEMNILNTYMLIHMDFQTITKQNRKHNSGNTACPQGTKKGTHGF